MLSNLFSKNTTAAINWNHINDMSQLNEIDELSESTPALIFKHSTRCPISTMSLSRFERSYTEDASFKPFFLDLIANRDISNEVANRYQVMHESPQILLIFKGKSIYDVSHNGIDFKETDKKAAELA